MGEQVFVHMELAGASERTVGFVEGLRQAAEVDEPVWYHGDQGYALDSVLDSLKERIGMEVHVVLKQELADLVADRLERSSVVEAKVAWVKVIERAELEFTFRCFSAKVGEEIRNVVESDLPDGVDLENYEVKEKVADDAKGVELYSPVHDYELSASGRYVGSVPGVFRLADRLHDQDFIAPGQVRFRYAD